MKIKFFAALVALLSIFSISSLEAKTVTLTTAVADDATNAVLETLQKAKAEGTTKIVFEKGVYNFYPEKALERFCYLSNHNDVLARIAFFISDIDGLTIDGGGSTFMFNGTMIPFYIENSKDFTVKNLTIDFAWALHSEVTVVASNFAEKTIDIEIPAEYPYEIRNEELFFVKPYYQHGIGQTLTYDKERKGPAYRSAFHGITTWGGSVVSRGTKDFEYKYKVDKNDIGIRSIGSNGMPAKELKPGLVRLYNQRKEIPVGLVITMKGDQGMNRFAPGFKSDNVTNFKAENVTVHHAGGMGFLFENCDNVDIYKCKVVPSQGRLVSASADATHFVGCRGKVSLRGCVFHGQLDDAANIHGAYQEVVDILDSKTMGIRVGHFQQLGFVLAKPGDKIGVVRLVDSFHEYATLTVDNVEFINGRYSKITFVEDIPSKVAAGDLLENLSAYPELLVENCDISRNRARGLLISTPRKTTIRNNYFSTDMTAILLPVESGSWYESGNATNVTIENNVFEDCVSSGSDAAVIRFHTDTKTANTAFKNIKIEGNEFKQYDNFILEISNVDGLSFKKNVITNSGTFPQIYPDQAAITIQHSHNLEFGKNSYKGNAKEIIKTLDGTKAIDFK